MAQSSTGYGPRNGLYFDGNPARYTIWETRFTNYLYALDKATHKAILPKEEGKDNDANFDEKNQRSYAELVQVLDERSLLLVMHGATDNGRHEALTILRSHYASTEKPRVLALYEQLTTLKMKDHEDVTDYTIRGESAAIGLKAAGENISDNLVIAMMLKGLPHSYQPFVVVNTQLDKIKSVTDFKSALHNYSQTEMIRNTEKDSSTALATKAVNSSRSGTQNTAVYECNYCGMKGHKSKDCRNRHRLQCSFCHAKGHVEKVCFTKKRDTQTNPNTGANVTTDFSFSSTSQTFSTSKLSARHKLMIDCGATSHIVNDKTKFVSFDDSFKPAQHLIEVADGH